MSITYKGKVRKKKRSHGFLARKSTPGGKKVIKRRRARGRSRLTTA